MHYFYWFCCFVQFVTGVALVIVVTMQASKNDGLQGQIGSTNTSSFKGKAGREEQLSLLTRNIAIVFFTFSILVAITAKRWVG